MSERASTVEGVRRANLGEVLRSVHRLGPRSRAMITAETGLNRSTVAYLVAELVEHGVVIEQEPDPTRRVGRPSPIVAASPDVVAIGINPEIDAVEIGAVSLGGQVRVRERIAFDDVPSVADVVETVGGVLDAWRAGPLAGARIVGAGVAMPGLVRSRDGLVRLAPHLGWKDADIAAPMRERIGLPIAVGNDASLGTRAELLFGAARDHADVVYLNGGSSGIGGGLVLHGMLIEGAGGYAGEWGQYRPGSVDERDRRSESGVLEDEVNRALLRAAADVGAVDDVALAAALSDASGVAAAEIERQRRILASTLANAINVLNPSIVVLGGFLAMLLAYDPDGLLTDVQARALAAPAEDVGILPAALGQDRLLIGAAEAAFAPLLADPLGVIGAVGS